MDKIVKYFEYKHLPPDLQDTSKRFHDLVHTIVKVIPDDGPDGERIVCLRKLLEAKDAAVRAALGKKIKN